MRKYQDFGVDLCDLYRPFLMRYSLLWCGTAPWCSWNSQRAVKGLVKH